MANVTKWYADDSFGPFVKRPGRQDFDFTRLFEDTVLSILPSVLLLLTTPLRIWQLWQSSRKVAASRLKYVKIVVLSIFSVLQIINLVVWCLSTKAQTRASLAAASLSFGVAVAISALSYMEHTRNIRPSSLINAYLLLTVFMDAARVRTLWLRSKTPLIAGVESAALAVKLTILMIEAKEKRNLLLSPYSEFPPEATGGFYSRNLFWWLNPMFLLGYRSVIRDIDLFPTDDDLASETLHRKFQVHWSRRSIPARRHELSIKMARCMMRPLFAGVFPRLCQIFFRYMQPLLIRRVTTFVTQPDSQATTYQGWGLTAAYGIVFFGVAISTAAYNHRAFRMVTMVRGALVTAIYTKTMDLSITALNESATVTLMSTDVQRICDALPNIHELWAAPAEICLAAWLLYSEVHIAMLGPLVMTVLTLGGAFAISSRISLAQKNWLASIQTRVDVTARALQSMKGVKMLGLNVTLINIIHQLRLNEIANSLKARRLVSLGIMCGNNTEIYAPGVTFAIYVIAAHYNGQTLNVSSAYTALSLMSLLSMPLAIFVFSFPPLMAAVGCFERIQEYLLSTSRHDHRLLLPVFDGQVSTSAAERATQDSEIRTEGIQLRRIGHTPPSRQAAQRSIEVNNLSLAWSNPSEKVIDDVSFELTPGITMLVGPIGSGKSSMLKGLLGELPSSKGYIYTDSLQIAFVGQDPWIQDGTLRENIIGMSTFEHKFYSSVVHACALEQDFENFSQGDQTRVGSAGTGLSGGQKLRVALARAVYSRRHIIVLDDVFSGLDATSEDRIFSRLLGREGLLRDMDATVLLATHAAHRLSYADKIIAINSQGIICEQGSFPELMRSAGYVSSLAARHTSEAEGNTKEVPELTKNAIFSQSAQDNAADDLTRAVGDLDVYRYYFASIGYGKTALLFVSTLGFAVFFLFPFVWINYWTSAVAAKGNSVNGKYLAVFLASETASWICLVVMSFHTFTVMIPNSARRLHARLLTTVKNAPLSFFTSTDIGQIINRFSQDMTVIDLELPFSLFQLTASLFIGVIQAIIICLSAKYFAGIIPGVLGLLYLIQKFYLRTSRQLRLMDLEAKAPLYSHFLESLSGLTTIRAFGWANDFEQRNLDLLDRSQRPFYLLFCIQRWLALVLDLTVAGLAVLLMILIVVLRSKTNAGLVGLALLSIMNFNLSLTQIIKYWTQLETSLGAIARVKNFVQTTVSEHLPIETESAPENWPSQGSIELSNVAASYTPDGPLVLKNINLAIPSGQKLGLVGRSGSGKSSFVTTLFHLLEISAGTVTIDGLDLALIPREQVRQRLNVIPQDSIFIAGTIRMNLDPFTLATSDNSLVSVLETVGLWNIVAAAGGLDVPMDPENLLSHGQRQLFCLARAIVNKHQSNILILDEATASVDLQTDETMQKIVRTEFEGHTIIAVAHRLGTIVDFDRVVVLDRGQIVEEGVPAKLLEGRESRFRKLWDS